MCNNYIQIKYLIINVSTISLSIIVQFDHQQLGYEYINDSVMNISMTQL